MHAGRFGGGDDRFVVGLGLEAGNVLSDRARQQLDVLRQIADVRAEMHPATIGRAPRHRGGLCRAPAARRRPACARPTICRSRWDR